MDVRMNNRLDEIRWRFRDDPRWGGRAELRRWFWARMVVPLDVIALVVTAIAVAPKVFDPRRV